MKLTGKVSITMVVAAMALFASIAVFVAISTRSMMTREAERTVQSVVKATTGRIDRLMTGVESATLNSAWVVGEHLDDPDYMIKITHELVANNEFIIGSTVAFEANYFPQKGKCFCPYTYREKGKVILSKLQYDYLSGEMNEKGKPKYEWYSEARRLGHPRWCEPYFDKGGADIWMSTFSVPIKDAKGKVYAILTADVSLEQLTGYVAAIRPYPQSYATMKTANGLYLVAPPENSSASGEPGKTVTIGDHTDNGWRVEIVCPLGQILNGAEELVMKIVIFSVAGLALIFLLSWYFSSRLQQLGAARERIASELAVASRIQTGVLPKDLPAGVGARMRPAREVGGDIYDFLESGDRLYFVVGDASGKGVPAALFSFMAETAFRIAAALGLPAGEVARHINRVLSHGNDMCMFVTMFVGVIDRRTGEFSCCNLGHNPIVAVLEDGRAQFVKAAVNLAAGVMDGYPYETQTLSIGEVTKLIVYTDGVTEAECADHAQFGENRLISFASRHAANTAPETVDSLLAEVDGFVSGAEQSDDITVMCLDLKTLRA